MKSIEVCQEFPNIYYPYLGTFVKQSVDALKKEGVDLIVVSPKPMVLPCKIFPYYNFAQLPEKEINNYEIYYPRYIYPVPKKYFYTFAGDMYSFFVCKYLENNVDIPDVIHAHFTYPDGYGLINLAKKWKIPLVISMQGTIERKVAFENKSVGKKIIKALEYASKILSVSHELKKRAIDLGIDEKKIVVVPNGVDIEYFYPRNKDDVRYRLQLPQNKKIILFVGALRPIKGVDYLITAAKNFVNEDHILIILGRDDGIKNNLIKKTVDLKISQYVKFVEPRPHEEMPLWISAADILVLPSLSEGRPNVILEAFASEVPVVATDVGGVPELVKDGSNGFLVEPYNYEQIHKRINYLLENESIREAMGKNGKKFIIENGLTWKMHAKKTIEVYNNITEHVL